MYNIRHLKKSGSGNKKLKRIAKAGKDARIC
jgi:hypothetical protein